MCFLELECLLCLRLAAARKNRDLVVEHLSDVDVTLVLTTYQAAQRDAKWCSKHGLVLADAVVGSTGCVYRAILYVCQRAVWEELAPKDRLTMRARTGADTAQREGGDDPATNSSGAVPGPEGPRPPVPSVDEIPNVAV